MKLQNTSRWSFRGLSFTLAVAIGLLAYGYVVVLPGYSGLIEEYRWSVNRQQDTAPPTPEMMRTMMSLMPEAAPAGEHHKPLRMVVDYPGVTQPDLVEANSAIVNDTDCVFGIIVHGKAYAFASGALLGPSRHIVNLMIGTTPISVTYCDLANCVRVLTSNRHTEPIDLHVGGLDTANQMVLLLDGIRYGQSSSGIPLEDFPVERMTFGEWKQQHPATLVYGG